MVLHAGNFLELGDEPCQIFSEITTNSDNEMMYMMYEEPKGEPQFLDEGEDKLVELKRTVDLTGDIAGTTSAESKKMTADEYQVMLYKRKLRNRLSASKSRKRHQMEVKQLQQEIGNLSDRADSLTRVCELYAAENTKLRNENMQLYFEGAYLRAQLVHLSAQPANGYAALPTDISLTIA
eukprot:Plantae.Rhodophyta-Purpureofilum_apyrenoidigerum.ctg7669.p1 GENE.Plantae.Rhodophyta-Purpureofilum_apyrenoidigerum.ctg7669~~Plantae.Rhodophyta-Purpureofilum_apyrenoidigerum.ctg7669.p1  ORF type:complete len:180 (+),score=44.67 Plantae.Rhodophyta-Purpureofilum_apyrenoidigerum.ctg7669:116-655(+)